MALDYQLSPVWISGRVDYCVQVLLIHPPAAIAYGISISSGEILHLYNALALQS